jgi:drug/metabolite transporter (DMT)-like permease
LALFYLAGAGSMPSKIGNAATADSASTARLLVVLLAFAWGFNWIAALVALREVPPWSMRFAGACIGAALLFGAAYFTGQRMRVPRGERLHIVVAGFFNVAVFQILSAFAQLSGATERAVIISYSMPIWTTLLSVFLLGERLNRIRTSAVALCVAGITILVWPLFAGGLPISVFYSLGCALGWALATVYLKWAGVTVVPLVSAAWQLVCGGVFIGAGMFAFEGYPRLWPMHTEALLGVLYVGVIGVGLAQFLWWSIVARLPTVTASLGSLLSPVVGVTASTIILGERPTASDFIGFVMIFIAAACVLLQPNVKHTEMPE